MKKGIILFLSLVVSITAYSQHFALKNNLVYDGMLTPNLGMEIKLAKRITLDISGNYNPFTFSDNKKFKHWLVQPELRFWMCEKFNGTFIGIHGHGGEYDVANIELPFKLFKNLKDNRYKGYFYGGGISIGHQFVLSKHWNLETSIGGGYARIKYDKYGPDKGDPKKESDYYNYFGVTKATISLIYIFK